MASAYSQAGTGQRFFDELRAQAVDFVSRHFPCFSPGSRPFTTHAPVHLRMLLCIKRLGGPATSLFRKLMDEYERGTQKDDSTEERPDDGQPKES